MEEIWKPIKGYKGYYISNQGNVKKDVKGGGQIPVQKYVQKAKNRKAVLKIVINLKKYVQPLCIHRLVAEHFLKGSARYVFHKDGDFLNNSAENLYYSDFLEHMNNSSKRKAVEQYSLADVFIASYDSITAASHASGAPIGGICCCCRGETHTSGGYKWRYAKSNNK